VLKLNLLGLSECKRSGDVGERLLLENDSAGPDGANFADELDVFDGFSESLETATILLQEAQPWAIYFTVNKQMHQAAMAQARSKGDLALSYIKRRLGVAEWTVVKAGYVFVRRVAHRGVITIYVECAHG
jgi:hypothetical protein